MVTCDNGCPADTLTPVEGRRLCWTCAVDHLDARAARLDSTIVVMARGGRWHS